LRYGDGERIGNSASKEGGRDGGQRTYLPQLDVIAALALVIKPVNSIDRSTLMVPPKDEEVFGELDFVGEEEADGFQRLLASVNVVAARGGREGEREGT